MQDVVDLLVHMKDSGISDLQTNIANNLKPKTPKPIIKVIENQLTEEIKPTANAVEQARKAADKASSLGELRTALDNFTGCNLYKTAQNTVFSDGHEDAEIMLIGEAPGASEDEQGIPFCGISGQLLDDIFKSIGHFRKKNLYISNSVFWRPPANRRPTEEEIAICRPFVEKHIALKKPKLIILIGSTAVSSLLPEVTETISKTRGKIMAYNNQYLEQEIKISAIFHPSYLLRQPFKKKIMWQDISKIKQILTQ
jgi:uracil-DNA glycosylase